MSGIYGADVAQLRALAHQLDQHAQELDAHRMTVGNGIRISAWIGPVAVRFRHQWDSDYSRRVHTAAATLRAAARALRRDADEQDRASAAEGGATVGRATSHGAGTASSLQAKWEAMTPEQRRALPTAQLRDVYGYTPTLPGAVRDEANRILLERYLSQPCPAGPPDAVAEYARKEQAYVQIEQTLRNHPDAQLLVLDPDSGSSVHVALSLGDVDHADHVAVYTQGWTSRADKPGGLSDPVAEMSNLRAATHGDLQARGAAGSSTAFVTWMDYDAPQGEWNKEWILNATQRQYAEAGSSKLAAFADGIRANNPGADIIGIAHSYGSTVLGLAAQQSSAFDSLVVLGSPGLGTDDLSQLNVGGNVFVGAAPGDLVAISGQFGTRPQDLPGVHHLDTGTMPRVDAHTSYLVDGSTGQRSVADVIASTQHGGSGGEGW
ncbi:alpha/beta hydrolase [Microbacterium sp. 22242]|uniref:alpha/beta hydrolase n=1 Tax=Microbacterium sp. 22242 TaxID=3453896 RepID=UPI003F86B4EF